LQLAVLQTIIFHTAVFPAGKKQAADAVFSAFFALLAALLQGFPAPRAALPEAPPPAVPMSFLCRSYVVFMFKT